MLLRQENMNYPTFFDQAPVIEVHDGLAHVLGACVNGIITYRYIDAVRLAGHSCPTVAGAYLMTRRALALLYPGRMPERGEIRVRFSSALDEGVTGVIASIVTLVTGATGEGGFKGIGGRYRRQNMMRFSGALEGDVSFERVDNGASIQLGVSLNGVPADPQTGVLLRAILDGVATQEEAAAFAALWQDRVKRILIDHADDPELIRVKENVPAATP